jgi:hypothetical protein
LALAQGMAESKFEPENAVPVGTFVCLPEVFHFLCKIMVLVEPSTIIHHLSANSQPY